MAEGFAVQGPVGGSLNPINAAGPGGTWVSSSNPASGTGANAVLVDSNQLAAGDYEVIALVGFDSTAACAYPCLLQHRNAANSANVNQAPLGLVGYAAGDFYPPGSVHIPRVTVATNERFRIVAGSGIVGGASGNLISAIYYRRVA